MKTYEKADVNFIELPKDVLMSSTDPHGADGDWTSSDILLGGDGV